MATTIDQQHVDPISQPARALAPPASATPPGRHWPMRDLFRETFLGFVRVHLLHHAASAPIFGTEMIEELAKHGYTLSPGTLYPMLHALEDAGYLVSQASVVDGSSRRYYRASSAGMAALQQLRHQIRELSREVLDDRPRPELSAPDAPTRPTKPGAHGGPKTKSSPAERRGLSRRRSPE